MADDTTDDLRALLVDFMRQEQCDTDTARHILAMVATMLGVDDAAQFLAQLQGLADEALAASGIFTRPARFLRSLYDTAIMSRLPAGHVAFTAILASPIGCRTEARH